MKLLSSISGLLAAGLLTLEAAEFDRQNGQPSSAPQITPQFNPAPAESRRDRRTGSGELGLEAALDFNLLWWTLDKTYSDSLYAPQASLLYGIDRNWDLRLTGKIIMARDNQDGLNADTDFYRIGIGSRGWLDAGGGWRPFVTVGLNYYLFDINTNVKNGGGASGMPGVSAEAGMAYLLNDWIRLHLALQGETSVLPGSVNYQSNPEKVWVYGAGLTLGASVTF